jgi:alkylmercury lyase
MSEMKRILQLIGTDKTAEEQLVCKAAFNAILGGEAVDRAGLVAATGLPPDKVETSLATLTRRGLVVIEPGSEAVIGSWGLSMVRTDHQLRIRGRDLYTWCALDAVGIPAALGEDAIIASRCAKCGAPVNIEMVAGHVKDAEPSDVEVWVAASQVGRSVLGYT